MCGSDLSMFNCLDFTHPNSKTPIPQQQIKKSSNYKKKHHNLHILDFTHPNSNTPKTNQEVLKLEKETSQSPNLGFHSSQLQKRNNKSRNHLSINTLPTNSWSSKQWTYKWTSKTWWFQITHQTHKQKQQIKNFESSYHSYNSKTKQQI